MKNKFILYLFLVSFLGLASCGRGTRPTVTFVNDLKEEMRTQAKDGSFIYSHFLNVDVVSFKNERKLQKTEILADLKLYHLIGFKQLVENAEQIKYRVFEGDSTEIICKSKDSALMVLIGITATITDNSGKKIAEVKDLRIPTQVGIKRFPYVTDASNQDAKCITANEHMSSVITLDKNLYYKNLNLIILNDASVFKKEQKYKLHFRVYDKLDPKRYFEGETPFMAY